jgi:hypothetical protein
MGAGPSDETEETKGEFCFSKTGFSFELVQ